MAGSNNFKEFNPSMVNIESDTSYSTDTTRINGVGTGMASSLLHNKLYRQASVMMAALAQFIANTNNNASDASLIALVTALTNAIASKNDLNTWALNKTVADTGTANSYKISSGFSYTAYYTGMIIKFSVVNANTGASVINVDNLGNISLVKSISTALVTGDISASQTITAIYDGTNFEIIPDYSVILNAHLTDNVPHKGYVANTTTADKTYYVATTGNDSNNGLASGTAFLTIGKAISMIPQIVNHNITVNVAVGTYAELPTISGFSGSGKIALNGGVDLASAVNYKVNAVLVLKCACSVVITAFQSIAITGVNAGFYSGASILTIFNYCSDIVVATSKTGFFVAYSFVDINNCQVSNKSIGILSSNGAQIYSNTNSGTGNTIGLQAVANGTIGQNSTQPGGTTATYVTGGSVIR